MNDNSSKKLGYFLIVLAIQFVCNIGLAQDFDFLKEDKKEDKVEVKDTIRLDTLIFESFNIKMSLRNQLVSLDSIITIAMEAHPQLKFQDALVDQTRYNLAVQRRLWSKNVYGFANYTWGDQTLILTTSSNAAENNNFITGYQVGVGARVPLYELYGRQSRVNQAKSELEASRYQKEIFEQNIRTQIIQEYFNLITAQDLMIVASESNETQDLNTKIAEKELLKGQMKMASFSQVHKIASDVREKYELSKQNFYSAFYKFEALVGVKMIDLKREQKK